MKYKCEICEKEFDKAGSLALHRYKKHGIEKGEIVELERKKEEKLLKNNLGATDPFNRINESWVFLGKKDLEIKGKMITMVNQNKVKKKWNMMEINKENGDLR